MSLSKHCNLPDEEEDPYLSSPEAKRKRQTNKSNNRNQGTNKYTKKVSVNLKNQFKEWLIVNGIKSKCTACDIEVKGGSTELKRHSLTKNHIKNIQSSQMQPRLKPFVPEVAKVKKLENATCMFLVEHDLPISFVEPFVEFIKAIPDPNLVNKMKLGKQKATNIIRQGLRPHFNESLRESLSQNYFSIYIDESTDVSTKSQMAIITTFYCVNENALKVDLIDLVELENWTANGIFCALTKSLDENKIPIQNWVGFCSDTTNVMMGKNHSVASLIKEKFPKVMIVKCSCHSIHLAASYACKKLPNSLEDLVRNIYNHFHRSTKRSNTLTEFQKFFEDKTVRPKKMLSPGQTRWLSLQACVQRILEFWISLEQYWRLISVEDRTHAHDQVSTST